MKTDVIFRTEKATGDIIAYFPYVIHSGFIATCYSHLGQHSACSHEYILKETDPCFNFEILKNELEQLIGYDIRVIRKRNNVRYLKEVFGNINI